MCFAMVVTSPMMVSANGGESELYCGMQAHSHSLEAGCHTLACESTDSAHVHTLEGCYLLSCDTEEHTHTVECENPQEATVQSSNPLPSDEPHPSPTPEVLPSELPSPSPTPDALPSEVISPSPTPEILPSEEPSPTPSASTDGLPMMSMLSEPMTLLSSGTETVTIQSTLGAGSTHDLSLDGSSYNLTIDITAQSLSNPKLVITVPKGIDVSYYPTASDVTLSGTLADVSTPVSKVTDASGNTILTYYFKANVASVGFNITLAPSYKLKPGSSYSVNAELFEDTVLQSSAADTITVTSNPTLSDGAYDVYGNTDTVILKESIDFYYIRANGRVRFRNYEFSDHYDYDSLELIVPLPADAEPGYYEGETFVPLTEGQTRSFDNGSVVYKTNQDFINASGTVLANGKALLYSLSSEHALIKYNNSCYYYYDNMGGIYLRFPGTTTSGYYNSPYSASVRAYIDGNTESSVLLKDYSSSRMIYNFKTYNISDYFYQYVYSTSTVGSSTSVLNIEDAFSFYNYYTNTTGETIEDIETEYNIPEALNCYKLSFNLSADPNNSRPSSAIVAYRTKNNAETQTASLNADDAVLTLSDNTDAFTYVHVLYDKLGTSNILMTGYIINKSNVHDNTGYAVTAQILSAKGTGSISDIPIDPQSVYNRNFYLRTSYSITPSTVSLNNSSLSKGDNFTVSFRTTNLSAYTTNSCIYMLMPSEFIFSQYNSPYSDIPYTVSQRDITVTADTATSYVPADSYTLYAVQYSGEFVMGTNYHRFNFTVGPEVDTATLRTGVYLPAAVAVTTENTMFPYSTSSSYNMQDIWDFDNDGDTAEFLPTSRDHPTVTINAVKTITAQSFLTTSYTGSGENTSQSYQFNSTGNYKLYIYNGLDSGNTAKNGTISITVPKASYNNDANVSSWNAQLTGAPILNGLFLAGAAVTYSTDGGLTYSASVSDYANVTNIKIKTASDILLQSSESASIVLPFEAGFPEGTGSSSRAYFEAGFSYYLNSSTSPTSVDIAPNTLMTAPVTVSGAVFKDYNANGSQDSNEQNNAKYYRMYLYKGEYTSGSAGLDSIASVNANYYTGTYSFSNIYLPGTYTVRVTKDDNEYFPETGLFTQDGSTNDAYYTFTVDNTTTAVENVNLGIVAPRTLTLNNSSITLYYQGAVRKIVPTVTPVLSDAESVTYSSSDESVVTVASDGTLTYVGDGNATITVSVPQLAALTGAFGDAPITSQVTVYARKTNYSIVYKDHSGSDITASLPAADYTGYTTYNYGSTLWLPSAEPYTRIGYTFNGWYTAQTGGSRVSYMTSSQYGDQAVYARWTPNSYGISYTNMSGASYGAYKPYSHTYGTDTTVSDPSKAGYEFTGWKVNGASVPVKNLTLGAEDYTSAITLTAVWSLADPTVTLVSNDADNTVTYGTSVTLSALSSHPINPAYSYAWYKAESGGSDTAVGSNSASLTLTDVSQSGSYYCIVSITDGTQSAQRQSSSMAITINKAAGSVTNISNISKIYDAAAVNTPSYTKAGDGAVTIEYKETTEADTAYSTTAPVDAGDYTVRISAAGDDNHLSTAVTKDFAISPRVITVTPSSGQTKVYGQADPVLAYTTNADSQVASGQSVMISGALTRASGENVGQYAIGLGTLALGDGTDSNTFKAANYTLALSGAVDFTITNAEMSVSALSYSGVYDGQLHSVTVSAPADAAVYYKTGSDDWSLTNPLIKDVTAGTTVYYKVEKPNYTTVEGSETVSITARPMTVKASSASKMYDGSALTYGGYQIESGSLASGESITSVSMTSASTLTDCGIVSNSIGSIVIENSSEDVTANYDITKLDGSLTITKRPVTIKANSASKPYDGTLLTDSGYSIASGSFAAGEGFADVTVVGSQTLVGTSENAITGYELSDSTKAENYTITTQNGTLTVEEAAIPIIITSGSASKTYDGKPLTDNSWSITSGALAAGDEIESAAVTGTMTNYGSASNVIGDVVIKHGTNDVTSNYNITKNPGVLTINKRTVQITADSADKTYDGTPLYAPDYSITKGSFAEGEGLLSVTVSGEQTFAGVSDNIIKEHKLSAAANPDNYEITYQKGTLTVRKAKIPVTVKASDDTAVYTGDPFSNTEFTIDGILAADDTVTAVTAGSITDVGSAENEIVEVSVVHEDGTDVTDNYVITTRTGVLTMESCPYTSDMFSISSISNQTYSGDALRPQPVVKYNGNTLIKGEDYTLSYRNNTVPGKATATVNFSGNYSGAASVTFAINAPDVKTLAPTNITDAGAALKGSVSPSVSGLRLGFYYKEAAGGTWEKEMTAESFTVALDKLKANTAYVCYAFIDIDGTEYAGEEIRFATQTSEEPEPISTASGKIDVSLTNSTQEVFTVALSIERGNTALTSVSKRIAIGTSFEQTFKGLEDGYYNIVARIGDFRETNKVRILNGIAEDVSFNITSLTKNTVVEVKGKAPSVAVGGMTEIFGAPVTDGTKGVTQEELAAKDIEIKVVVDEVSTVDENRASEMAMIEDLSENQVGMFIDFSVIKKVTDENGSTETKLSEVPGLLEIAIPIPDELLGKNGYVIYRVHDGEVNTITEEANSDGEYIEVTDDGYIILYVRKFSTYAIGYSHEPASVSKAPSYWYWWAFLGAVMLTILFLIFAKRKESKKSDEANNYPNTYI